MRVEKPPSNTAAAVAVRFESRYKTEAEEKWPLLSAGAAQQRLVALRSPPAHLKLRRLGERCQSSACQAGNCRDLTRAKVKRECYRPDQKLKSKS